MLCWYCWCDCCCFCCCCSAIKLGDCGFELGGEIITFLLMSINTAAVSRCSCCSWVRFLTCISCCCCCCCCCCCFGSCWICCWGTCCCCCWGWCRCIVWVIIDGCCCCCWLEDDVIFILSIGITDTEFASRFCRCVLLSTEVTDFAVWLLLLRNAWRAAIASCSADAFAASEAGEEAIRCSSFSDDCERISCEEKEGRFPN